MNRKGFTLLEVLLVVGVASVLITSGIFLYSMIDRNQKINDTVDMINIIAAQVRKTYANSPGYGDWDWSSGSGNDIELGLFNNDAIPAKYKSDTASSEWASASNRLVSPFDKSDFAIAITGHAGTNWNKSPTFRIRMRLPQNAIPQIAKHFDPGRDNSIARAWYCRAINYDNDTPIDMDALIAACGSSDDMVVNNFDLTFR